MTRNLNKEKNQHLWNQQFLKYYFFPLLKSITLKTLMVNRLFLIMIISDFTNEETKILTFTEITGQCYFLCKEKFITAAWLWKKVSVARRFVCEEKNPWNLYFIMKLAQL